MTSASMQAYRKRALTTLALLFLTLPGIGACLGDSFNNIYDPTSPGRINQ